MCVRPPASVFNNVGTLVCCEKPGEGRESSVRDDERERVSSCCSFCEYVPPPWTCLQNGLCSSGSEKTLLSLLVIWARYSWPEERTRKGGRCWRRRRREVKKGFPSSYGIYLPSSPSGSFGRGPETDSFCELARSEVAISVRQQSQG